MPSRHEFQRWLDEAKSENATHVICVADTFDWTNYPVNVGPTDDFWTVYDEHNGKNMQKIMEVYDLSLDLDMQLNESRAFHMPPRRAQETPR